MMTILFGVALVWAILATIVAAKQWTRAEKLSAYSAEQNVLLDKAREHIAAMKEHVTQGLLELEEVERLGLYKTGDEQESAFNRLVEVMRIIYSFYDVKITQTP